MQTSEDKKQTIDKRLQEFQGLLYRAKAWRQPIEDNWRFLTEMYTSQNAALSPQPELGVFVNSGKVFELTETFVSYFIQAVMFRDRFFDASPLSVGSQQYSSMVVELLAEYISSSNFTRILSEVLRQLVLTGNTGMSVSVRNNKLMFECIDIFRTYLLPGHSVEVPNFIYDYRMSETELYEFYKSSPEITQPWEEFENDCRWTDDNSANNKNDITATANTNMEYFNILTHYYWCYASGKYKMCFYNSTKFLYERVCKPEHIPLIVTAITLQGSPYGMSPLESSVGLISEMEAFKSFRMTAAKVASYYMFVSDDGMVPDDLVFEPNKVFRTSKPDALLPLQMPANGYQPNAAEEEILKGNIYTNVGLGNGVSANQARKGERVTATEIESLQKASGTRLNLMFQTLEVELFSPIINYAARAVASMKGNKPVRIYNINTDSYDIYSVPHQQLKDYKIILDISKVKERMEAVQKLLDFVAATGNIPAAQEVINYKNIISDIVGLYGFPDPSRYLVSDKPAEQPTNEQQQHVDPYTEALAQPGLDPNTNPYSQQLQQGMMSDPATMALMQGQNPNDPVAYQESADTLLKQQVMASQAQQLQPAAGAYVG